MADRELTGVLLLGGGSRRFGSNKALAELEGETLAERAWRVLGDACEERLAVGKAADGLALPFPVLDDGSPIRHPAAGLLAALSAARRDVAQADSVEDQAADSVTVRTPAEQLELREGDIVHVRATQLEPPAVPLSDGA